MKPRRVATAPYETYPPLPHQKIFHGVISLGEGPLTKFVGGGWGAGKSTMCIEEAVELACKMPGGQAVVARESMEGRGEISLIPELRKRLDSIGGHWNGKNRYELPNGFVIWALPLDDPERFGSFPLCWAYIQEAHEAKNPRCYQALYGRLRDPAAKIDGRWYLRMYLDARGVSSAHWLNTEVIEKGWNMREPWTRESCQDPQIAWLLCRTNENAENLPPGYEADLRKKHEGDLAWIKTHLDGEIGYDVTGRAVFGDSYDPDLHVADRIIPDSTLPIWRGWDFGYRAPGGLFVQYTRSGRLLVLRECAPKNLTTDAFVDRMEAVREAEFAEHARYLDACDFAGTQVHSGADQRDIEIVEGRLSTELQYTRTNIEFGLGILRKLMLSSVKVKGQIVPRFAVDRSCTETLNALGGGYYYPEERLTAPPIKGGTATALIDCARYIALQVVEEGVAEDSGAAYPNVVTFGQY